jgi:hypothetical protein
VLARHPFKFPLFFDPNSAVTFEAFGDGSTKQSIIATAYDLSLTTSRVQTPAKAFVNQYLG